MDFDHERVIRHFTPNDLDEFFRVPGIQIARSAQEQDYVRFVMWRGWASRRNNLDIAFVFDVIFQRLCDRPYQLKTA